jgi:hypothetical protein
MLRINTAVFLGSYWGLPALQLYAGVSSFETISPVFKSDQSWRLKFVPLVPSLILKLIINNIWKLSFGTPFWKKILQLWLDKGLASLILFESYKNKNKNFFTSVLKKIAQRFANYANIYWFEKLTQLNDSISIIEMTGVWEKCERVL